ncbi:MAG: protein-glutamate O-methyltransferase CheR [Nitrospirota bacterium]|jgi:chemotaxis protein methyltransferase CheR
MARELSEATFQLYSEFIYDKTGIHIPLTKKYLVENRLIKVLEEYNLQSYDELFHLVRYTPNGKLCVRLFDAITTNETFFFREPQQFDVLVESIVSRVIQYKKGCQDVRIWSAACSTGEEPYTVSLVMREKRPFVKADILGSDISRGALEAARRGVYNSYAVRNVPEAYMKKYFTQQGQDAFALNPEAKGSVRLTDINLMDGARRPELENMDVIFCRNVLIYFDDRAKQRAVSILYDSLRPGGFLFIGSSESLHNVTRAFRPVTFDKVLVYEKV